MKQIPIKPKRIPIREGGAGSGDYGHAGRPGQVGGSASGGGSGHQQTAANEPGVTPGEKPPWELSAPAPPRYEGDDSIYSPALPDQNGNYPLGRRLQGSSLDKTDERKGNEVAMFMFIPGRATGDELKHYEGEIKSYCDHAQLHPGEIAYMDNGQLQKVPGGLYYIRGDYRELNSLYDSLGPELEQRFGRDTYSTMMTDKTPGGTPINRGQDVEHLRIVVPFTPDTPHNHVGNLILDNATRDEILRTMSGPEGRHVWQHLDFNGAHLAVSAPKEYVDSIYKRVEELGGRRESEEHHHNSGATRFIPSGTNFEIYPVRGFHESIVHISGTLVRAARRSHVIGLEVLIKRYQAKLWQTTVDYQHNLQVKHGNLKPVLAHLLADYDQLGHQYLQLAANIGVQRALDDLQAFGWIKSVKPPVLAHPRFVQNAIAENYDYLHDSLLPALEKRLAGATKENVPSVLTSFRYRIQSYGHYAWRAAEQAYRTTIQEYNQWLHSVRDGMREAAADGDAITANFIGPDDEDTCNGCDGAVQGNPYTIDTVPEPGSFECTTRCRHMVQLSEEAPDDLAPMRWESQIGFAVDHDNYYQDVVPDQERPAESPVTDEEAGGVSEGYLNRLRNPFGAAFTTFGDFDSAAADDYAALSSNDPADAAVALFNLGLTPDDLASATGRTFSASQLAAIAAKYGTMLGSVLTEDFARQLLDAGLQEQLLTFLQEQPQFADVLNSIAAAGFDDADATQAEILANVLGKRAYIAENGRWYLK